jgi:hypothetical protein
MAELIREVVMDASPATIFPFPEALEGLEGVGQRVAGHAGARPGDAERRQFLGGGQVASGLKESSPGLPPAPVPNDTSMLAGSRPASSMNCQSSSSIGRRSSTVSRGRVLAVLAKVRGAGNGLQPSP